MKSNLSISDFCKSYDGQTSEIVCMASYVYVQNILSPPPPPIDFMNGNKVIFHIHLLKKKQGMKHSCVLEINFSFRVICRSPAKCFMYNPQTNRSNLSLANMFWVKRSRFQFYCGVNMFTESLL